MPNPDADPKQVERLAALRGTPLTLLAAFAICAADLVTAKWLNAVTRYSQDTIASGLLTLIAMGFIEKVDRYTYRLTPYGRALAAPMAALLSPEKTESLPNSHQLTLPTPENSESENQRLPDRAQDRPETQALSVDSGNSGVDAPLTSSLINTYINNGDYLHMLEALRAAGVYHNLRDKLARELLADTSTDWLRQVLGWTAYLAAEGANSPRDRGATVKTALTARQQVPDDTYLPPLGLRFSDALAWAERGGQVHTITPPNAPETSVREIAPPDPPTDDEELWRRVLAGLRMTTPASTLDTMLSEAALVCGPAAGAYTIVTPQPERAAWLQARLAAKITRELEHVTGQPAVIRVVCPALADAVATP